MKAKIVAAPKTIDGDQVKKWVQAFAVCQGRLAGPHKESDRYIRAEHEMIICLAPAELDCAVSEVMSNQLPPAVDICFRAFRPLWTVYLK